MGRSGFSGVIAVTTSVALLFGGCTSTRYKLVKQDDYVQPETLSYIVSNGQLEANLVTLIYYNGPGSWKKNALWDEYYFSITNPGDEPVELRDIVFIDPLDYEIYPTVSVFQAEDSYYPNARRYRKADIRLTKEVNPLIVTAAAAAIVALEVVAVGGVTAFGYTAGLYLLAASVVLLPVVLIVGAGTAYKNNKARDLIREEIDRRVLKIPRTLEPGETIEGSLFYPIIPSPKEFQVRYRIAGQEEFSELLVLVGPLDLLKGIHEKVEE